MSRSVPLNSHLGDLGKSYYKIYFATLYISCELIDAGENSGDSGVGITLSSGDWHQKKPARSCTITLSCTLKGRSATVVVLSWWP
jgi:hypothetical protein